MKYGIIASLAFMISNCIAMDNTVDWTNEYKKYAQSWYECFSGTEREMLKKLSDIVAQKENDKRYELVAQCLKEIYEYSERSEKELNFLGCSISLLDPSNTFHRDFNQNNPLLIDILDKINYQVGDGPEDSDI